METKEVRSWLAGNPRRIRGPSGWRRCTARKPGEIGAGSGCRLLPEMGENKKPANQKFVGFVCCGACKVCLAPFYQMFCSVYDLYVFVICLALNFSMPLRGWFKMQFQDIEGKPGVSHTKPGKTGPEKSQMCTDKNGRTFKFTV